VKKLLDIVSNEVVYTVEDAIKKLNESPDSIVIAGGTDVLIKIRAGKVKGAKLVSIREVAELKGITRSSDGEIKIGPLTTFRELESNEIIKEHIPMLGEAASTVGGPQIRAVGTIGGNICNGAPSADTAPSLFLLNAELELTSADGVKRVAIENFYKGAGKVKLTHGTIVTAFYVQEKDYSGFGGHYIKYSQRRAMDIANIGCGVQVKADGSSEKIDEIRVAFGVAAPVPIRLKEAEESLRGVAFKDALNRGAELVRAEITPRDSWRASKKFRLHIAGEIFKESLGCAWKKALSKC
jgi:xanthine dehydrogenase FAD-binding subunit